jgi:hypothetical protein
LHFAHYTTHLQEKHWNHSLTVPSFLYYGTIFAAAALNGSQGSNSTCRTDAGTGAARVTSWLYIPLSSVASWPRQGVQAAIHSPGWGFAVCMLFPSTAGALLRWAMLLWTWQTCPHAPPPPPRAPPLASPAHPCALLAESMCQLADGRRLPSSIHTHN